VRHCQFEWGCGAGPSRYAAGYSTPGATPPGSPLAQSQSAFSTFGGPLSAHYNPRWQLHVERVTERGLALISLIFRKLEALTQMVLSEHNAKRFGLHLDKNYKFWGQVVHDILTEISLPRCSAAPSPHPEASPAGLCERPSFQQAKCIGAWSSNQSAQMWA
jgi:hypothetical protein